jgi:hypothetical protein
MYAMYLILLPHLQCYVKHTQYPKSYFAKVILMFYRTTSRKQHRGATEVVQFLSTMCIVASC